ncbi:MAG: hypothetical protein NTV69_07725 [Caldilinea sp.]|nr:hypothetical protein [Caldilinea sp.]
MKEYVWLDDTLIAILGNFDGSTYQYVETDHLGTPRAVVHPTENTILWRWDLTPTAFGEHLPNGNPDGDAFTYTLNLRYPGQYFDAESGLHYNYFRDYEPATGRYIESDPIGLAGGASTYGYVLGNPLGSRDTNGLWPSIAPFATHQDVIRRNIHVSPELMNNLLWAQEYADSAQFQTGKYAYRHGMRNKGQSACAAIKQAEEFVRKQLEMAIFNRRRGKDAESLWEFSMALHTLQDSTSPSHIGFQEWGDNPKFFDVMGHVVEETFAWKPSEYASLVAKTGDAWRWYTSGNLPDSFFGDQSKSCGCTP